MRKKILEAVTESPRTVSELIDIFGGSAAEKITGMVKNKTLMYRFEPVACGGGFNLVVPFRKSETSEIPENPTGAVSAGGVDQIVEGARRVVVFSRPRKSELHKPACQIGTVSCAQRLINEG